MDGGRVAVATLTDIHRVFRLRIRLREVLLHRGNLNGNNATRQVRSKTHVTEDNKQAPCTFDSTSSPYRRKGKIK